MSACLPLKSKNLFICFSTDPGLRFIVFMTASKWLLRCLLPCKDLYSVMFEDVLEAFGFVVRSKLGGLDYAQA